MRVEDVPEDGECDGGQVGSERHPAHDALPRRDGDVLQNGDADQQAWRTAARVISTRRTTAERGSCGTDIKVSTHHTVSVSSFQSIEVSSFDWMVFLDTCGPLH